MIRIWIMFTCLQRRHYNKAPLVWINMCSHWGKHAPQLYNLLKNYITIFDEYPVEKTHSILRSQTKGSDTADELSKKAKSIFQSKDKQSHYRSFFTTPKQFSFSHNQLRFLKVRCAEVLCLEKSLRVQGKVSSLQKTDAAQVLQVMLHFQQCPPTTA